MYSTLHFDLKSDLGGAPLVPCMLLYRCMYSMYICVHKYVALHTPLWAPGADSGKQEKT
jgi:hypothetical protein